MKLRIEVKIETIKAQLKTKAQRKSDCGVM